MNSSQTHLGFLWRESWSRGMAQKSMHPSAKKGRSEWPKQVARNHVDGYMRQSIQLSPEHPCFSPPRKTRHQISIWQNTRYVGCRDGLFTLKALINACQNHDLPLFVGFINLVKAYDTANHALLLRILEQYGAPPKFVAAIKLDSKTILQC